MHVSRNTREELPKCKYFIVTLQTINVVFAIITLFVELTSNRSKKKISYHWIILKCFMAILAVFVAVKVFLCYKDQRNPEGSSPKNRCKRDLLIGYGAISIFGYIPLIYMFVNGYRPFFPTTISTCYVLPGFILPLFILQNLKKYQVCRGNHSTNLRAVCVALHVIILMVIAFCVDKLKKTDFAPYFIMWDTLMFSTVRAEFLVILVNGVWLKGSLERPNDAELGVQEPLRKSSNGLDPDARSHDSTAENSVRAEVNHKPGWQTRATTKEFRNFGHFGGAEKSATICRVGSGIIF
ncbi:hypothetical protein CAEBREN_06393 [Caenorhabditis brenneri]|uniref:Uncharacterized protein n=1 Tax=Caenorhabditis brenneri TaxID=135651 RepID=G0N7Z2_CAEBE|nr:hypothetical protein CAEBREN_06393 [Caenorhabditis brenneri]